MTLATYGRLALLPLLAAGCGTGGGPDGVITHDTLRGSVVFDGEELSRPQEVEVVGGWLLVGDVPRPRALHVIDRAQGRHLASWGREGRGPGEFLSLWGIQREGRSDRVWLYDPGQTRLTLLDVSALVGGGDPLVEVLRLQTDFVPMTAVWVGDSAIVSSGLFADGRFARFDRGGVLRSVAGPLPSARDGTPAAVAQHAYSGTLVAHPERSLIAIATRHADRLEIHHVDGRPIRTARGPLGFEPVYEVKIVEGHPNMATGDELRFGYVDAAAEGEHIYALYSGRTRGEPGKSHFGGEVHVFDWEGRLLRILPLDERALAIAVDPDERTLYTIRHDPEPAVLRYELP